MTTTPPALATVTTAYIAMLRTVTGFAIGDGERPPEASDDAPYAIVYEISGTQMEGDAANSEATAWPVLQVTCAGRRRDLVGMLMDRVRTATFSHGALTFTNAIDAYTLNDTARSLATDDHVRVIGREFDSGGDMTPEGILFSKAERYRLWVAPS